MNHEIEAAAAAVGSKATYGGAGITLSGWMLSNEFAVLAGLVIGVAGFAVNWFYKARDDRRKQSAHEAYMAGFDKAPEPE